MAVKSTPVQHEEVDYAELCTRLQQQVNSMETTMTRKLNEQQEKYEAIISELRDEVTSFTRRLCCFRPYALLRSRR
jgi:phage host-nuclease inhibitor protein Gam